MPSDPKKEIQKGTSATATAARGWARFATALSGQRGILGRFVILYPLIVITLSGLFATQFVEASVDAPLNRMTASVAARFLSLIGFSATASGADITYANHTVAVKTGCSGLELLAVLVPAILVFPSTLRAKLAGILAAVLFVLPLNAIRVASLSVLLARSTGAFELFHLYFWQAGLVACLFGFFVIWMKGVTLWSVPRSS